jgi:hypothetical protein
MAGAEWEMDPVGPQQLKALSKQSGGQNRLDLAGIWSSPKRQNFQGTRMWWLLPCALFFLIEALWSRLGGQRIQLDFSHRRKPILEEKVVKPKV